MNTITAILEACGPFYIIQVRLIGTFDAWRTLEETGPLRLLQALEKANKVREVGPEFEVQVRRAGLEGRRA